MATATSGLEFAGYLAVGAGLGYLLDLQFLAEAPSWFFIGGLFVGFAGGLWMIQKKIGTVAKTPPPRPDLHKAVQKARADLDEFKKKL